MSQPNQGFNSSYGGNSINGQTITNLQAQQISKIGGFVAGQYISPSTANTLSQAGGNIGGSFINSSQFRQMGFR